MLLGIDLGTNALKAGLFDLNGQPLAIVRRSYAMHRIGERGAEQDPDEWWRAACDALGEICSAHDVGQVAALCVVGQGPSLVVCDDQLRARTNALIWADQRAYDERVRLSERLGYEVSVWSLLPKISWLHRERPDIFDEHTRVMQAYDFIAARLAGQPFASQFGAYPPFGADEFARAGLDPRWIPPIVQMTTQVGVTRAPWCAAAHLREGIPIIAGVYDAIATTLGTGLVEVGRACDYGGNSGGFGLCWSEPLHARGINAWQGLLLNQYIIGGATANAGSSIDWFARTFGGAERLQQSLSAAETINAGADGVIFLPYLLGERAPLWDDDLRAAFVGLTLHHGYAHLLRAVFEGVAFGLRLLTDSVTNAGGRITELRVCGGTARYELLNQIKADVLGVPVLVSAVIEASLLGGAMLGGVGVGLRKDYVEAVENMVHVVRCLMPHSTHGDQYQAKYERFLHLTELKLK